eukprot:scaffold4648_cov74-Cylindrotheca_fusiformis.AAC.3
MGDEMGTRDREIAKTPAVIIQEGDQDDDDNEEQLAPVIRCHTPEAFESRVWDELEHCALAYHVVNYIVTSTNQPEPKSTAAGAALSDGDRGIDPTEVLGFSFQAFSPCKSRSLFVTTLARLCLLIEDSESIKNHHVLKDIWSQHCEKPHALFDLAITSKKPQEEVQADINAVFEFLRNQRRSRPVPIVKNEEDGSELLSTIGWKSIKARVFVIWLKFSAQADLDATLMSSDDGMATATRSPAVHHQPAPRNRDVAVGDNQPAQAAAAAARHFPRCPIGSTIGIQEFLKASKVQQPSRSSGVVLPAPAAGVARDDIPQAPRVGPSNRSDLLSVMTELGMDDEHIVGLRPISQAEMDELVKSYLFIYTDEENYVLELAPIEVYSAGNLRIHNHERKTGHSNYPDSYFGLDTLPAYKMVKASAQKLIDYHGDVLHVLQPGAREFNKSASETFFIQPNNQLIKLLLRCGSEDKEHSPGSVRLNFGCGGLCFEPGTGAPSKLIGIGFLEKLNSDEKTGFLSQVGTLVYFIWQCMQDMQLLSKKAKLATNVLRNQYSNELCRLLKINGDTPIENVTLSFTSLYPVASQCLIHKDIMNDQLYSYSKTGSLNLVYITGDKKSVFLLQESERLATGKWCLLSVVAANTSNDVSTSSCIGNRQFP